MQNRFLRQVFPRERKPQQEIGKTHLVGEESAGLVGTGRRVRQSSLRFLAVSADARGLRIPGFDWDAMDRLYEKGFITNPKGKAKSVVFTEEGLAESERLFWKMFGKPEEDPTGR